MKTKKTYPNLKYKFTKRMTPEVVEEILAIHNSTKLTAENVLERARYKKSALHNLFEWRDDKAAENWRLHEARHLINEVKIVIGEKELYAFENIRVSKVIIHDDSGERIKKTEREYKSIIEIIDDKEYRNQIINTAMDQISLWKNKYEIYSELNPIFDSIKVVKNKIEKGGNK